MDTQTIYQQTWVPWTVLLLAFAYFILPKPTYETNVKVPTIRYPVFFIPKIVLRLLFNTKARTIIDRGYEQVKLAMSKRRLWVLNIVTAAQNPGL